MSAPPTPNQPAGEKKIKIQVIRLPTREKHIIADISTSITILAFQQLLQGKYGVEPNLQALWIAGVPPKPIPTDDSNATLGQLGIRPGDSIELRSIESMMTEPTEMKQGKGEWNIIGTISGQGSFKRKEMPADNSCMFHAIAYLCANKQTGAAAAHNMRELAANMVASDPAKFNTTFLGSPNHLYQDHILNPNTWGGGIELAIFASNFQTEIIAFDPKMLREDIFGQNENYAKRVFLIYTGEHYDGLVFQPNSSAGEQVIFSTKDENAHARARDYIESLHNELVSQGKATKLTEWRHNKDLKRTNALSRQQDVEREKRVAAEKSKISVTSAADLTPTGSPTVSRSSSTNNPAPTPSSASTVSMPIPVASPVQQQPVQQEWSCHTCTCVNPISNLRCMACDWPNPFPPASTSSVPSSASRPSPPVASPPSAAVASNPQGGFNCSACTAWNEAPATVCSVCGTGRDGSAPRPIIPPEEDDLPAPIPQRDQQLIGGGDDLYDAPLMPRLTPQQLQILAQPWNCPRCTMYNPENTPVCTACRSSHPNPALNPSAAPRVSFVRPSGSSSSGSSGSGAPVSTTERLKEMFKGPPPWQCERCGKSQSSQLLMCGNCGLRNAGLQMKLQEGDQGCAIM